MVAKSISGHPGATAQSAMHCPCKVIIRNFKEKKKNTAFVSKGVLCALGFITLGAKSASANLISFGMYNCSNFLFWIKHSPMLQRRSL